MDAKLNINGIDANEIIGYENQKLTNTEVAIEILEDRTDFGLGMEATARGYILEFIYENLEKDDPVVKAVTLKTPPMINLIEWLKSEKFLQLQNQLGGYETRESGNIQYL